MLVYEMATGRPPFMHKNHMQLGNLIRSGNIIFPDPDRHKIHMSEPLKDLITKLLDRNALTRLGSKGGVNEVITHPFFAGIDFKKLQARELD